MLFLLEYLATYVGLVHFLAVRSGALSWGDVARPGRLAPSTDDWGGSRPISGWARVWGRAAAGAIRPQARLVAGDILVPLAMILPVIVASNVLSGAMLLVLGLRATDITPANAVPTDTLSRLLTLVTVAVIAPLGEEIFFRGFATNAWGRSLSRNSTILRASLFFAFIHVMNTISTDASVSWRAAIFNFGARVPVAFALSWLYMRRRSIIASGTLHAGYNGVITLLSFL